MEGSWYVLASRMRFRTAGVAIMISRAATRPGRSIRFRSVWERIARMPSARVDRIWPCSSGERLR
jgi:hypothetical protein